MVPHVLVSRFTIQQSLDLDKLSGKGLHSVSQKISENWVACTRLNHKASKRWPVASVALEYALLEIKTEELTLTS